MSLQAEKIRTQDASGLRGRQSRLGGDITGALRAWQQDDGRALERLIPEVVEELRRLARGYCRREPPEYTLQPTALVNEVYLRLHAGGAVKLSDRGQFFAFAARLMREILIDHARSRRSQKRGGGLVRAEWEEAFGVEAAEASPASKVEELLALGVALDRLGELCPRQRSIVELRLFTGLTLPEISEVLGVSLATVERGWKVARRWLGRELVK